MGRHARIVEKETPITPQDDARRSSESFRAHEALTMAVGAAYNYDHEGLRTQLLTAYNYFAYHSHLNIQIWFVERMITIFDAIGWIIQASYLSQALLPAMQDADKRGEGFMLAAVWNPW